MNIFFFRLYTRNAIFNVSMLLCISFYLLTSTPASAVLNEFFSATGRLASSVDGAGSNNPSHTIDVEKPNASATVRAAFLMAASNFGRTINNGNVTLNGTPINWDELVSSDIPSNPNFFVNVRADVTTIVKPVVDAAAPGRISFTLTETTTASIDGEALVVVFDDPTQTADSTVILLFGAQETTGDTFAITLANPIDLATGFAEMGLGISFSFQGAAMISTLDVNGQRLTSSAGGQDDGVAVNGALITVGGLDDSNTNPPPNADPGGDPRFDDELYSLLPFLSSTDTNVFVETLNPTDDDNIFFAYFKLSAAAILGEGVVLGPTSAVNEIGTDHTVTATVVDNSGVPVVGREVIFTIISGPNTGTVDTDTTDTNGNATFTYNGTGGIGIDQIQASFIDSQGARRFSNVVTKEWISLTTIMCDANGDSIIDRDDINLIFAARGTIASPGDPRDVNGDGLITVNDSRACVLRCTNLRCAP